ncbi:DUF1365 family protein [Vibrio sp. 404]|uniref:DUF1365 family protein n=1 Tax=Vibrio marinisediminis TaxID=2758441 RepID=A0A7W2FQZ0_9VIBR|nr:DUF1365 family protein [Vibrio marinisediminis]MBA5762572.1 DUF1365 family protein [Vibrio marinisediminis]
MNSSLLVGHVRHRRFSPVSHSLNYPLFMPCLDLDELEQVFEQVVGMGTRWWHWARFRREDYLGEGNLKNAVLEKVFEITGEQLCDGRVEAVIHLRYLGIYFSPVNFYYVYDQQGQWRYVLAEVSNTPWNERHYYAIPATSDGCWQHKKAFHVSPFNPLEQTYHWRLKPLRKRLNIHLECHREQCEFDATLLMRKQDLGGYSLLKKLIATPIMAVKVTIGIYWHALKLWVKGAPFYSHPKYLNLSKKQNKTNKGA